MLNLLMFLSLISFDGLSIAQSLGPVSEKVIEKRISWNDKDYQMHLQVLAHGYSDFDKTQAGGVVDNWEVYSGVATLKSVSEPEAAPLIIPVLGKKWDSQVTLRLLDLSINSTDRATNSESVNLWMLTRANAKPQDREIEFQVSASDIKSLSTNPKRHGGYTRQKNSLRPDEETIYLAGFDYSKVTYNGEDIYFGVLAIADPTKGRETFDQPGNQIVSQRKIWELRRELAKLSIPDSEDSIRSLDATTWKPISAQIFGQNISVDEVIAAGKLLASTANIESDLTPTSKTRTEGRWHKAIGCDALEVTFYPVVGRLIGDQIQWVSGEWFAGSPTGYQFFNLTSRVQNDVFMAESTRERHFPGQKPMTSSGHFRLN